MKKYLLFLLLWFPFSTTSAQLGDILKRKAGEGARQGAASGTEKALDKGVDKLFHRNKKNSPLPDSATAGQPAAPAPSAIPLSTYSKYDFVPGEKILGFDDFSQDAVGDFPGKWTTNASGEIVTTNEYPGKWLNISKEGSYLPQFIKGLSDNFTLEYDLIFIPPANPAGPNTPATALQVINAPGSKPNFEYGIDRSYFQLDPYMGNISIAGYTATGEKILSNEFSVKGIQRKTPFRFHVSVWRQKSRLRVYLDQTKVVDAPSLLSPDIKYNGIRFATTMSNDGSTWLIGNFKFASGLPDTRNKLLTEGKFSTTGILFDVNSATIKPNSYGTLKDIAALLKDNPGLTIKIIGHTDNVGDAKANLELSRKRAGAVKAVLASEFSIEEGRLQADGKGADLPAAPNTTPEGRAQNRRVEFIKL
jgi:outer membrane protein OmpA-like peptidoglycan-associated protein